MLPFWRGILRGKCTHLNKWFLDASASLGLGVSVTSCYLSKNINISNDLSMPQLLRQVFHWRIYVHLLDLLWLIVIYTCLYKDYSPSQKHLDHANIGSIIGLVNCKPHIHSLVTNLTMSFIFHLTLLGKKDFFRFICETGGGE